MKIGGLFRLIRPLNSFMIGLAVIVGTVVSKGVVNPIQALSGFFAGFSISSYSMVMNDYFDLEVDRINVPKRPLVKGEVDISEARILALSLLLIGLFFSAITGLTTFLLALAFSAISFLYNWKFKEYGIFGNFMVAASMAIPFIYGALITGKVTLLVSSLALTAFFAGTGREVIKDIVDVEGDKVRNVRTVPITHGEGIAGRLGAFFFILAITSSIIPIILREVGLVYNILIGVTDVIFIVLAALAILNPTKDRAYTIKKVALYGMLLGLIGYLLEGLSG